MLPYKVHFSDNGTQCALLDVIFERPEFTGFDIDFTSQELETVLRAELEKYKGKTKRDIIAQGFLSGGDEDQLGLPMCDHSRSITYIQKKRGAFTDYQLSGKANVLRETLQAHYRVHTVQHFGPKGVSEHIILQAVFKDSSMFTNVILAVLFEVADDWLHVHKDKDFYVIGLAGRINNPMSWRPVGGCVETPHIEYNAKKKVFIFDDEVVRKLGEPTSVAVSKVRPPAPEMAKPGAGSKFLTPKKRSDGGGPKRA
jgi:hypothetical protein